MYQIGTSKGRGRVATHAAASDDIDQALEECRRRSLAWSVHEAWLRPASGGEVIAAFVKGEIAY